jgi:hypothetical protein
VTIPTPAQFIPILLTLAKREMIRVRTSGIPIAAKSEIALSSEFSDFLCSHLPTRFGTVRAEYTFARLLNVLLHLLDRLSRIPAIFLDDVCIPICQCHPIQTDGLRNNILHLLSHTHGESCLFEDNFFVFDARFVQFIFRQFGAFGQSSCLAIFSNDIES